MSQNGNHAHGNGKFTGESVFSLPPDNRILIADDHPATLEQLTETLTEWGYSVVTASDGRQAWAILQQPEAPRLAILDRRMPGLDGAEICRRVRQQAQEPYIYILLLTVYDQEKQIAAGLQSGADDYIVKPYHVDELRARLDVGKRILGIQHRLIEARDRLQSQATIDPVTGMWNRSMILEFLRKELSRAHRRSDSVGLAVLDLDHFKAINDEYGHQVGDAVMRETGERLRDAVRSYDAIGRYGGDEFLSVHPGCSWEDTARLGERLRAALAASPMIVGTDILQVTASVGVASSDMLVAPEPARLVFLADAALYTAKRSGRDRVEIARPDRS
jgi:diguanylate cyclase (GGDEF)-like protein